MALDERYFVTADLEEYFVDKDTGLPLAGGFINFYRDVARSTPKTVFQLTGAPPNYTYAALPNPIELSSVGTVQNSGGDNVVIYYYPYDEDDELDLYYIEVTDSNGVVQFTREAWPNITSANDPTRDQFPIQNQISNPQFTKVFINENESTIYTVSSATNQEFIFAPDWTFVISGTGSVTVERVAIAGNEGVPTSPPYVLDITLSGGITACYLRQRFNVNSGLWASTPDDAIFLSGTLIARNENAGTTGIQMYYAESSGGLPVAIVDASFDNSQYQVISGVTADAIPDSTNTDTGADGYVDVYLSFLNGAHVRISSIQVVPTSNQAGADFVEYDLNSSNREQALMGDYYIPRLSTRPSESILTAWDFPLNPFQFAASGSIGATAGYICDQTIALRGSSGAVTYGRNTVTNGIEFTTAGNNDSFYIMQYLSGAEAKKILGTPLSVNVFGYRTSVSDDVTMRVYLFRAPAATAIPTLPTSIGTVATSGVFTLSAAGWTEIPRGGLDTATATLPLVSTNDDVNNTSNDMSFTGWELTSASQIGDTDKFAIVVTFAYVDTGTDITINSISLTPSAIPTRPSPKSFSEVLEECEYYYEKTYDNGTYPGASSQLNSIIVEQAHTQMINIFANALYMPVRYKTTKRVLVTPSIYAQDGTLGSVSMVYYQAATNLGTENIVISGNWTLVNNGTKAFAYDPVNRSTNLGSGFFSAATTHIEVLAKFHFVADARLGII